MLFKLNRDISEGIWLQLFCFYAIVTYSSHFLFSSWKTEQNKAIKFVLYNDFLTCKRKPYEKSIEGMSVSDWLKFEYFLMK